MDAIRFQLALARHNEQEKRMRQRRLDDLVGMRPTTAPPNIGLDTLPEGTSSGETSMTASPPPPTPVSSLPPPTVLGKKSQIADLERYEKMMLDEYE